MHQAGQPSVPKQKSISSFAECEIRMENADFDPPGWSDQFALPDFREVEQLGDLDTKCGVGCSGID